MELNYRVFAKISKGALLHNIKEIRRILPENTLLMSVVKADGYGHNADFVSGIIEPYSDYFAVATIEEALLLRRKGIKKPILLLGYTFSVDYKEAVENDISITIFTLESAQKLSKEAELIGKPARIHIAVDTGMGRIGFIPNEKSAEEIEKISKLPSIEIEGIFTHFALADELESDFTRVQAEKFCEFKEKIELRGINIPIKHLSNSSAIINYPKESLNLVRSGLIIYGLYPSENMKGLINIKPAMEIISSVVFVKDINEGDSVSYGRTFIAKNKMRVATIPVGYADGYPRILSNKGKVIINGKYAPIIGRICMDQFMVDVTDIENVKEGDMVTIMGRQGNSEITADEIARDAQTINYEIICTIGKRVPRILGE